MCTTVLPWLVNITFVTETQPFRFVDSVPKKERWHRNKDWMQLRYINSSLKAI